MRPILSLLCVLLTLACPHLCAAKRAAGASSKVNASACCEDCRLKAEAERNAPGAPASERNERGCFCDGAAFDVGGKVSLEETPVVDCVYFLDNSPVRIDVTGRLLFEASPQPPPIAGMLARIQIASLLL